MNQNEVKQLVIDNIYTNEEGVISGDKLQEILLNILSVDDLQNLLKIKISNGVEINNNKINNVSELNFTDGAILKGGILEGFNIKLATGKHLLLTGGTISGNRSTISGFSVIRMASGTITGVNYLTMDYSGMINMQSGNLNNVREINLTSEGRISGIKTLSGNDVSIAGVATLAMKQSEGKLYANGGSIYMGSGAIETVEHINFIENGYISGLKNLTLNSGYITGVYSFSAHEGRFAQNLFIGNAISGLKNLDMNSGDIGGVKSISLQSGTITGLKSINMTNGYIGGITSLGFNSGMISGITALALYSGIISGVKSISFTEGIVSGVKQLTAEEISVSKDLYVDGAIEMNETDIRNVCNIEMMSDGIITGAASIYCNNMYASGVTIGSTELTEEDVIKLHALIPKVN